MTGPSTYVRGATVKRDGGRCVSCGARVNLEYQHRRAEGMGGRAEAPSMVDGVTCCTLCNIGYEGAGQRVALRWGWKVRSWVTDRGRVPVYYILERTWYRLLPDGGRERLSWHEAMEMMTDVYGPSYDEQKGLVF